MDNCERRPTSGEGRAAFLPAQVELLGVNKLSPLPALLTNQEHNHATWFRNRSE